MYQTRKITRFIRLEQDDNIYLKIAFDVYFYFVIQ